MVTRFYLTGHHTLANRGCEAIVRTTASLLRSRYGDVRLLIPSTNVSADRAQWPEADSLGVTFVPCYSPRLYRYWAHVQRLPVGFLKRAGWPVALPRWVSEAIAGADCVISVGGDNYSLDYLLPSLLMKLDAHAMDVGKPVVLWGASVGPFEREPDFVPVIRRHLKRMALIVAREPVTFEYLRNLGLKHNTIEGADPAFTLTAERLPLESFWPREFGNGVLGLNISPLLARFRPPAEPRDTLLREVASFIKHTVGEHGLGVLLIPHVIPHDGSAKNNDVAFMAQLLPYVRSLGDAVRLVDTPLNAAQTKYVISQCRFFVGARTHSTISALASGVPTVSIAYSRKAEGLNLGVFGHTKHVLRRENISAATLIDSLTGLMSAESEIRAMLSGLSERMRARLELAIGRLPV